MLISGIIWDTIQSILFGLLLFLDAMIYSLISWVYQIILVLCNADILGNGFEINALVNRIYIILGVVILFLVAYSLLKSMVNPDEAIKGKKSPVTIVKDVLISVVLIAIVPTIFSFAMGLQEALLTRNTLGNIILGTSSNIGGEEVSSENLIQDGGMTIAAGVLEAFLHPNYDKCQETNDLENYPNGYKCDNVTVKTYEPGVGDVTVPFSTFWQNMIDNNNLFAIVDLSNDAIGGGTVTYYWVISSVAGVFVLFVLISYCFDIAVRAVKLAVYELIAPIPILARIMPNEQASKVFGNWVKATISTFVEVFIRLAILFFSVLIIKIVRDNFWSLNLFNGEGSVTVALFAQMFLILGIILFVKQAPEILKEITGLDSGKYNPIKSAMQAASLLGGGVTAAVRNWNDKTNPKNPNKDKNAFNRFRSALGGAGSAALRSTWNRDNVKDFKSMKENATNSANSAVKAHNDRISRQARYARTGENRFTDLRTDIRDWATGSFEAQQQLLDEVNAFVQDAKAVKSTSEGFVRDKKYLFNYGKNDTVSSGTKSLNIAATTTLSEMEAMIQSLKSSGDVDDAKMAAALDSLMNKQIKVIGQDLVEVANDKTKAASFDTKYRSATSKGIEKEAMVTLNQTKSAYDIVKQRYDKSGTLSAVQKFKVDPDGKTLKTSNVSKLSDYLESQASEIQQEIKLEQEKRKAKDKK